MLTTIARRLNKIWLLLLQSPAPGHALRESNLFRPTDTPSVHGAPTWAPHALVMQLLTKIDVRAEGRAVDDLSLAMA